MTGLLRMNPLTAVGLLLHVNRDPPDFLGSCFAFRRQTHFLTAAHCIGTLAPKDLAVSVLHATGTHAVETIHRHPKADLAILALRGAVPDSDVFGPFGAVGLGQDFGAYGFPEDVFGVTAAPTARFFKGHIQRFTRHHSHQGYEYTALEMSIGAPAGLSGGPVFLPHLPWLILGIVTENHRSTTFLQSVQEIQEGSAVYKEVVHEAINYGLALLLRTETDFLDAYIPVVQSPSK